MPDPYHGTPAEYGGAFDLVLAAARGLTGELAVLLSRPAGGEPALSPRRGRPGRPDPAGAALGTGHPRDRGIGGQHGVAHYRRRSWPTAGRPSPRSPGMSRAGRPGARPERLRAAPRRRRGPALAAARRRRCRVPEVLGWDDAALVISWIPQEAPEPRAAESGSAGNLPACTRRGPGRSGLRGRGSSPGCRCQRGTANAGDSWPEWYAGSTGCCLTSGRAGTSASLTARGRRADRDRGRPRRATVAGPREAAGPDPRRLLVGQRPVVGRPGLADRPGGARRPPGDRPGHAGPVRRAVPVPDRRAAYEEVAPLATAGGTGCRSHQLHPLLVHVCLFGTGLPGRGRWRRPAPRWPWRPEVSRLGRQHP